MGDVVSTEQTTESFDRLKRSIGSSIAKRCPENAARIREHADVRGYRGVDSMTALGNKTNEQCKQKPQCFDMLNRPVAVGDVVWDSIARTFVTHLADTTTPDNAAYEHCVRVPGPGEQVPHFDGWQSMCRAMQASGAAFQWINKDGKWDQPNSTGQFGFCDPVTRYRRSQGCKWKGPK
jgi:hypothetical protein